MLNRFLLTFLILFMSNAVQANEPAGEECKEHDFALNKVKTKHLATHFASKIGVPIGQRVQSNCIRLMNFDGIITIAPQPRRKFTFSVNNGPLTTQPVSIQAGATVQIDVQLPKNKPFSKKFTFFVYPGTEISKKKTGLISWYIQTANQSRPAKNWFIGPNQAHRQISEIINEVTAGDTIYLDGDASYNAIDVRGVSGKEDLPIKLVGIIKNGKRPVIQGGIPKWGWTFSLRNSHHWHLDNLIIEGGSICYRHQANGVKITNTLLRNCGNAILASDSGSGSLLLTHIEVSHSGGKEKGRNWRHGVYVTTDRDRFPNSVVRIENSLFHHNKGNSIKSRAERTELYYNWIETGEHEQSKYAAELIGFDGYRPTRPIQHDMVGNVLVLNSRSHAIRVGGDGTGVSKGPSRVASNLFVIMQPFNGYLIRLAGALESFEFDHNLITTLNNDNSKINLIRDFLTAKTWVHGKPDIKIRDNYFAMKFRPYVSEQEGVIEKFEEYYSGILVSENSQLSSLVQDWRKEGFEALVRVMEQSIPKTLPSAVDFPHKFDSNRILELSKYFDASKL